MTGLIAEIDSDAAAAREEAASGGDGIFAPLPKGKYQAVIVPIKEGVPLEVQDWGGSGPNAQKKVVRLAFKVIDESPTGKGRYFYARIPLFSRFAPKAGEAKGKSARAYWDFFERALGLPEAQVMAGQLPGAEGIVGKRVTITLSEPIQPQDDRDLQYNPLGKNEIAFYDAPATTPQGGPDFSATPLITPGVPVAAWLTPDNKAVVPGFVFEFQEAQQKAQQAAAAYASGGATPGWGAAPAAQPAAPGGGWGAPAAGGAPGWGATPAAPAAGAWAQPAQPAAPVQASPELQAAAAQAASY